MLVSKNSQGLYDPSFEHDACGIGFVANIKGSKSHQHITDALTVLENMEHRGACGCESNTGDGAGIMIQVPHEFFFDECIKQGIHLPSLVSMVLVLSFSQRIKVTRRMPRYFQPLRRKTRTGNSLLQKSTC